MKEQTIKFFEEQIFIDKLATPVLSIDKNIQFWFARVIAVRDAFARSPSAIWWIRPPPWKWLPWQWTPVTYAPLSVVTSVTTALKLSTPEDTKIRLCYWNLATPDIDGTDLFPRKSLVSAFIFRNYSTNNTRGPWEPQTDDNDSYDMATTRTDRFYFTCGPNIQEFRT